MFKIIKMILTGKESQEYSYDFTSGINFFVGANSTGKTVFYSMFDFMFGEDVNITKNDWNNNTIVSISLLFAFNNKEYQITRTIYSNQNYFWDKSDIETESIGLEEYKEKLNSVFSHDEDNLRRLRDFVGENFSYRAFTMFNFLGENGQGQTRDFLDKCRKIEYATKLAPILNYIFNGNVNEIETIKKQVEELKKQIKLLELKQDRYIYNCAQINNNLRKLNIDLVYNGRNTEEILKAIVAKTENERIKTEKAKGSVGELEVVFSNIEEQIKIYEATIENYTQSLKVNENRKKMLSNLHNLAIENEELSYLVFPIEDLLQSIEDSIAFSKYIISDETVGELRKQKNGILAEIQKQNAA